MFANTSLFYSFSLILSNGKKSFENLGRAINKSGDTVRRLLSPAGKSFELMRLIAAWVFRDKNTLVLTIDDTLIKKIHSRLMVGTCWFYDTKIGKKILAYKLLAATLTDGKFAIPVAGVFLFSKELLPNPPQSKEELVQNMVCAILKLFPDKRIIVAADGAFATIVFLTWCVKNSLAAEVRMHSNRKVMYKGKKTVIREIKGLQPKGRQMARTISVVWHGISLYITAQRRIDKHGKETIVYQAATYAAKPSEHVSIYLLRWPIEMVFRTTKQSLGIQDCYSRKIETQLDHIAGALLAYALAQLEMKRSRFDTPEDAIRALGNKNIKSLQDQFCALDQIFGEHHA